MRFQIFLGFKGLIKMSQTKIDTKPNLKNDIFLWKKKTKTKN